MLCKKSDYRNKYKIVKCEINMHAWLFFTKGVQGDGALVVNKIRSAPSDTIDLDFDSILVWMKQEK